MGAPLVEPPQAAHTRPIAAPDQAPRAVAAPKVGASQSFDRASFGAALALGSAWALLHVRKGSLRWGWLCLLGAAPAAILVWGWLATVARTFETPYYVLFDRSTLQGMALVALLLRLALSVPMALNAARSEHSWSPRQSGFLRLGAAGVCAVLMGLALDKATYGSRRSAALEEIRSNLSVVVFYLGREPRSPRVGHWTVGVRGPWIGFGVAQPMEMFVSDDDLPIGRNVALASESLDPSRPNREYYLGTTDLSFTAVGAHPSYELRIGGQIMRSGDLQEESAR